jgi:hypothetical protein
VQPVAALNQRRSLTDRKAPMIVLREKLYLASTLTNRARARAVLEAFTVRAAIAVTDYGDLPIGDSDAVHRAACAGCQICAAIKDCAHGITK